jgi:dihydrodipicolinate reductase
MANVGGAVLVLGQHLPYIAVAAGAIGVYLWINIVTTICWVLYRDVCITRHHHTHL